MVNLAISVAKELKKVNYFKIIVYLCARNHYFSDYEDCSFVACCNMLDGGNRHWGIFKCPFSAFSGTRCFCRDDLALRAFPIRAVVCRLCMYACAWMAGDGTATGVAEGGVASFGGCL